MSSPLSIPRSSPNTPSTIYMDTAKAKAACAKDKENIEKKCKPAPPPKDEQEKTAQERRKKKSLTGKLAKAAEGLDAIGKSGYTRDPKSTTATAGNGWMEDHCSGLWLTVKNINSDEYRQQLQDMLKKIEEERVALLTSALKELAATALQNPAIKDAIVEKLAWLAARTAGKAVIGALGVFTAGTVTAIAAAATVADIVKTTAEIADLMGSEGKILFDTITDMASMKEKTASIVQDMIDTPDKAHANMQELMAKMNPCVKARKCNLVPFKRTTNTSSQKRNGTGCCPGQTGHHVIPDSMVKDAGCEGYKYADAPVICLEGSSHHGGWGSHGTAHQTLATSMEKYRETAADPNAISYEDAKKHGIDAIREAGASHCDRACLEAQLDEHYKCDEKKLKPADGTGPFTEQPHSTDTDVIED